VTPSPCVGCLVEQVIKMQIQPHQLQLRQSIQH